MMWCFFFHVGRLITDTVVVCRPIRMTRYVTWLHGFGPEVAEFKKMTHQPRTHFGHAGGKYTNEMSTIDAKGHQRATIHASANEVLSY